MTTRYTLLKPEVQSDGTKTIKIANINGGWSVPYNNIDDLFDNLFPAGVIYNAGHVNHVINNGKDIIRVKGRRKRGRPRKNINFDKSVDILPNIPKIVVKKRKRGRPRKTPLQVSIDV